jgi:CO/xanthine dehydrogenase Mo-binding subunit
MEYVPAGPGPYNSLAIGKLGNVPAAAVANAVADACGVRITDLKMDEMEAERFEFTCFLHSTRHAV